MEIIGKLIVIGISRVRSFPDPVGEYGFNREKSGIDC